MTTAMRLKDACSLEKQWQTRHNIKTDITLPTKVHIVKAVVFPVVRYGCELYHKEGWALKNWGFWIVVLEKIFESPLDGPKKGNAKECSIYCTIALISHASKVMLKILQVPDVQAGFRKGRGTRDQSASNHWIIEKAGEFQKNIYFCFIDYAKAFDCVDHKKL